MGLTVREFLYVFELALRLAQLCRPAVIQPPIVPGRPQDFGR